MARWRVQMTSDSLLEFCAPPELVQVRTSHLWTLAPVGTRPPFVGDDWLSLNLISDTAAFDEAAPWPPSLTRDVRCAIHCLDVSGYQVHWESIGTKLVRVETGRVTGGYSYVQNKPMLEAAWLADSTRWIFAQGQASSESRLSELRAILRTVRVRR
jgi:hypothetical protein